MVSFGTLCAAKMSDTSESKDYLTIEQLSGNDKSFAIELIGQVRFTNDAMFLYDKSGEELGNTLLKDLGKIVFQKDASTNPQTSLQNTQNYSVLVYPNPTKEILIVNGMQPNSTIRIFTLQGQLVTATPTNGENAEIFVGNLQHGTYLLQVGADIVKIIKQ